MAGTTRSRVAWAVAAADIVVFLIAMLVNPIGGPGAALLFSLGIASFTSVGALLITRVPANPIGVLLHGAGTLLVAGIAIGALAVVGAAQVPPWPWWPLAKVAGDSLFFAAFIAAFIAVPLVFPDGRLPSPRFRWVVVITAINLVILPLAGALRVSDPVEPASDAPLTSALVVASAVEALFAIGTVVSFGAGALAIWLRFRRGDRVQRQQVKWLVAVVGVQAAVIPTSVILTSSYPALADALSGVAVLSLFTLPVVIAIAILRYRLFEIDRIVSRTIGWAVVSGLLLLVFTALVVGLQAALTGVTQGQTLAVAASTLAAFALFQPLRRRVQRAVDRRFDRARYDGERTAQAFARRVRNQVEIDAVIADLRVTVDGSMSPAGLALWLRVSGDGRS